MSNQYQEKNQPRCPGQLLLLTQQSWLHASLTHLYVNTSHAHMSPLPGTVPFQKRTEMLFFSPKSLPQVFLNRTGGSGVVLQGPSGVQGSAVPQHSPSLGDLAPSKQPREEAGEENKQRGRFHLGAYVAKGRSAAGLKRFLS